MTSHGTLGITWSVSVRYGRSALLLKPDPQCLHPSHAHQLVAAHMASACIDEAASAAAIAIPLCKPEGDPWDALLLTDACDSLILSSSSPSALPSSSIQATSLDVDLDGWACTTG
jgi:hypothetical protein